MPKQNPLSEAPRFALNNLTHQSLRSLLTLLGVVIGIAAIVTLFSLGAGLNNAVNEQFEQLGSNTLYVMPSGLLSGGSGGPSSFTNVKTLNESLVEKIRGIGEVEIVLQNIYTIGTMKVGREQRPVYILTADADEIQEYVDTGFLAIREGRLFDNRDTFSVIVGNEYVDQDIFDRPIRLGSSIEIEDKSFTVIGVTKPAAAVAGDPASVNNSLFIPKKGFEQLFEETDPVFLIVKTHTVDDVQIAKDKIIRLLDKEFGKDQKLFEVQTTEQLQEQVGSLVAVIQLVLVGIASISLLVGGVGIANTMIMSVLERTSEIGVMKSIGATNTLVLSIFLLEAGFIGLIGGVIGLILGYMLAFLIGIIATASNFALSISIDPFVIVGSLFFAVLVGMIAGYFPAKRAASMDPVEALRGNA